MFGPEPQRERGTIDDQLSGSIISARTYDENSFMACLRVARHFQWRWHLVGRASLAEIQSLITGVTFPEKKALYLKALWQNHPRGFSYVTRMPVERALIELELNHGVGRKVSAAALNFSDVYGRAFVADTQVLRVLHRFGFIDPKAKARDAYYAVMISADGMTAHDLFELHWHLKYLGQQICTHRDPQCARCPLASSCMRRTKVLESDDDF